MLYLSNDRFHDDTKPAHPDGKPWRKACDVCAFRRSNPQGLTEDDFDDLMLERDLAGLVFQCVHRDDNGFSRECACWAAINRGRARASGIPVQGGDDV